MKSRDGLGLAAIVVCCAPILILGLVGAQGHWPAVAHGLCGENISECEKANHLRNLLELSSFAATTILLPVGVVTVLFAAVQLREATNTRNATIYLQITGLWGEQRAVASRALLTGLDDKFRDPADLDPMKAKSATTADYIRHTIEYLEKTDRKAANDMTYIMTVLENIGVLCAENLVSTRLVVAFIGGAVAWQMGLLEAYLTELRHTQPDALCNADFLYRAAKNASR